MIYIYISLHRHPVGSAKAEGELLYTYIYLVIIHNQIIPYAASSKDSLVQHQTRVLPVKGYFISYRQHSWPPYLILRI